MPEQNARESFNFIDLFAGAGGLSEGFLQAGLKPIAHVEMNEFAARTLETRSGYYYLKSTDNLGVYKKYLSGKISREEYMKHVPASITKTIINETMSDETLPSIFKTIDGIMKIRGISKIDVIVGGPPCQAYSLVGRAQSSHMEVPMAEDPRNYLYKLYARFLKRYQPRMFVFENVTGIESANGGTTWKNIKKYLKRVGYEIECREQNAHFFGVLQNRRRMIIVGWLKQSGLQYPDFLEIKTNAVVNDLFTDLPKLHPGESMDKYAKAEASKYVRDFGIRTADDVLTLHDCRPNIDRDIKIYRRAVELWNDGHKRLNYNDLPDELKTHKNRHSFTDRFKVVEGDEPCCHTILAHLSKDGHYFIHPDNHPEGIKGAEATASAIFLARTGAGKGEIMDYISIEFGYDLSRTCDEIRPTYHHVESCQKTVPEAVTAFLEGTDFEDVIHTAVSLGGDCDTLTCKRPSPRFRFAGKTHGWTARFPDTADGSAPIPVTGIHPAPPAHQPYLHPPLPFL